MGNKQRGGCRMGIDGMGSEGWRRRGRMSRRKESGLREAKGEGGEERWS